MANISNNDNNQNTTDPLNSEAEITEALSILETAKVGSKAATEAIATIHTWYSIWTPSVADHSHAEFAQLVEQLDAENVLDRFTDSNSQAREILRAANLFKKRQA